MEILAAAVVLALLFFAARAFLPKLAPARTAGSRSLGKLPADGEAAYLMCAFSMLGSLAQVDGKVSHEEIQRVSRYIDETLKLDPRTRRLALETFEKGAGSPLAVRDYAEAFHKHFPDRVQLADQIVRLLIEVSAADGTLSSTEDEAIQRAALMLGLTKPGYERLKREAFPEPPIIH